MEFQSLIDHPSDWMQGSGPHSEVVMTSRIRLARNLRGFPFPGYSQEAQRLELMRLARPVVESLGAMQGDRFSEDYATLSKIRKQVLVERHLISREHAARAAGCAVVVDARQNLAIMINEEDHFRAWKVVDTADSELEARLPYAFDAQLGYLTACPTNVGTGLRASVMLHLPALVLSEQINLVSKAVGKIGLAVRGLYGEGTEALGNLFQISNQHTLGESESDIISSIEKVIERLVSSEINARHKLMEENATMLQDQVGRAYAILRFAHVLQSKEALTLLSMLRLGADLDLVPQCDRSVLDNLLLEIQPAHLQWRAGSELSPLERDIRRAEITRSMLKNLQGPATLPNPPSSPPQGTSPHE